MRFIQFTDSRTAGEAQLNDFEENSKGEELLATSYRASASQAALS